MSVSDRQRSAGKPEPRRNELVDLYRVLEISPYASQDVIQAAYRVLARNYHPDVNASAEAALRIRQLNAAYRVLSDPQDRARYDLECSRAHRHERLSQMVERDFTASAAGRTRVQPLPKALARPLAPERFPVLSGQAILGLLLVAALAGFLLIVLWATFDTSAEYGSGYGPTVEWSRR